PRHGRPVRWVRADNFRHHLPYGRAIQRRPGCTTLSKLSRLSTHCDRLYRAPALGTPRPRPIAVHRHFRITARTFDHRRFSLRRPLVCCASIVWRGGGCKRRRGGRLTCWTRRVEFSAILNHRRKPAGLAECPKQECNVVAYGTT